jgi:signal transduction histidine kinase
MKEKYLIYSGLGMLSAVASLTLYADRSTVSESVFAGLVLLCILTGKLFVQLRSTESRMPLLMLPAAAVFIFFFGIEPLFPALCIIITELAETLTGGGRYIPLSCVIFALLALIFGIDFRAVLIAVLLILPLFFTIRILNRLEQSHELLERRGDEIELLNARLRDSARTSRTLEYTARLEERNRLAARIHDKIGHGVSGSIILIEAGLLSLESNPETAVRTIKTAADTLRGSVDDIRQALREERSERKAVSIPEIRSALARFSETYPGIKTDLNLSGSIGDIPQHVWYCIYENLQEALTNLLKHSSATLFAVTVSSRNKLIHARFSDNGEPGQFRAGMGLQNMEERCALYHGRCFFRSDSSGFHISMTFTQSGI